MAADIFSDEFQAPKPGTGKAWRGVPLADLIHRIADGDSVASIARQFDARRSNLHAFLMRHAPDEYKAAQVLSADAYMEKAEDAIIDASSQVEVSRARELANHYRFMAKIRSPSTHGDRQAMELTGKGGAPIASTVIDPTEYAAIRKKMLASDDC